MVRNRLGCDGKVAANTRPVDLPVRSRRHACLPSLLGLAAIGRHPSASTPGPMHTRMPTPGHTAARQSLQMGCQGAQKAPPPRMRTSTTERQPHLRAATACHAGLLCKERDVPGRSGRNTSCGAGSTFRASGRRRLTLSPMSRAPAIRAAVGDNRNPVGIAHIVGRMPQELGRSRTPN